MWAGLAAVKVRQLVKGRHFGDLVEATVRQLVELLKAAILARDDVEKFPNCYRFSSE